MNEISTAIVNIKTEANAIAEAARDDAGFDSLLKFKKGTYECGVDEQTGQPKEIPLGTELIAHVVGWTKCWIKFIDGQVAERKMYPVIEGKRVPDREELDCKNEDEWPYRPNTKERSDPWVYQYILPVESHDGEFQALFVTSSMGGRRAVADLGKAYSHRAKRTGISAQPIIKLGTAIMPSKAWGDVDRPLFEIAGWDENVEGIRKVAAPDTLKQENPFDDSIPF
jgi:hypothetical protein